MTRTSLDLNVLRMFNRNVERIWAATTTQNLSWRLEVTMNETGAMDNSMLTDDERMRALATSLRQMLLSDDCSYLNVRKRVSEHLTLPGGRQILKDDKRFWMTTLKEPTMLEVNGQVLSNQRILDIWFYGEVFHRQTGLAELHDFVSGHPLTASLFRGLVQSAFHALLRPIQNLYRFSKHLAISGGVEPTFLTCTLPDGSRVEFDLSVARSQSADGDADPMATTSASLVRSVVAKPSQ